MAAAWAYMLPWWLWQGGHTREGKKVGVFWAAVIWLRQGRRTVGMPPLMLLKQLLRVMKEAWCRSLDSAGKHRGRSLACPAAKVGLQWSSYARFLFCLENDKPCKCIYLNVMFKCLNSYRDRYRRHHVYNHALAFGASVSSLHFYADLTCISSWLTMFEYMYKYNMYRFDLGWERGQIVTEGLIHKDFYS